MRSPKGTRKLGNPFKRGTQLHRLLKYFAEHPGEWAPMPKLAEVCGSYVVHTKVAELRLLQIGVFENQVEHEGRRAITSYYRFIPAGSDVIGGEFES